MDDQMKSKSDLDIFGGPKLWDSNLHLKSIMMWKGICCIPLSYIVAELCLNNTYWDYTSSTAMQKF